MNNQCRRCGYPTPDLIDHLCFECWERLAERELQRDSVALSRPRSHEVQPYYRNGDPTHPATTPLPRLDRAPRGGFAPIPLIADLAKGVEIRVRGKLHQKIADRQTEIFLAETRTLEAERLHDQVIAQRSLDLERRKIEQRKLDLEKATLTNQVSRELKLAGLVMDRDAARFRREIAELERDTANLRRRPGTATRLAGGVAKKQLPAEPPLSAKEQELLRQKAAIEQIQKLKDARSRAIHWATDGLPETEWSEEVSFEVRRILHAFNRRLEEAWEEFSELFGGRTEK